MNSGSCQDNLWTPLLIHDFQWKWQEHKRNRNLYHVQIVQIINGHQLEWWNLAHEAITGNRVQQKIFLSFPGVRWVPNRKFWTSSSSSDHVPDPSLHLSFSVPSRVGQRPANGEEILLGFRRFLPAFMSSTEFCTDCRFYGCHYYQNELECLLPISMLYWFLCSSGCLTIKSRIHVRGIAKWPWSRACEKKVQQSLS